MTWGCTKMRQGLCKFRVQLNELNRPIVSFCVSLMFLLHRFHVKREFTCWLVTDMGSIIVVCATSIVTLNTPKSPIHTHSDTFKCVRVKLCVCVLGIVHKLKLVSCCAIWFKWLHLSTSNVRRTQVKWK